jgi:hypothetical protein
MLREIQAECKGVRIIIEDNDAGKEVATIAGRNRADIDAAVKRIEGAVKDARSAPPRAAPAFASSIPVRLECAKNGERGADARAWGPSFCARLFARRGRATRPAPR